jgi:hypothetical protein
MDKKIKIRTWDELPGSYFRELRNIKFFDADPDPGYRISLTLDPGSGMNIPDPQHWV